MKSFRLAALSLTCSLCLLAHPMGNFSINHYTKIDLRRQGPELTYILDFAEIPTSELFGEWGKSAESSEGLQRNASRQAQIWAKDLTVTADSKAVPLSWSRVSASTIDGAGGMPVLRVVMTAELNIASSSNLAFQDQNYANRTGWKEVVIAHSAGVEIDKASQTDQDLSKALTVYPADLTVTPPQDLAASVRWHVTAAAVQSRAALPNPAKAVTQAAIQTAATSVAIASSPSFSAQQPDVAGTVKRGDYLSNMLRQKHFGLATILLGLIAAFGLGAIHAMSPGHGKTIVAAYLVGSRGTLKHAGILGLTVTFTHTVSVFLLGIGVLFFQKYVIPEKVVPVLGAISGLSIVAIGAYLLYQRTLALLTRDAQQHSHPHPHEHKHDHPHPHVHPHTHDHPHPHVHPHTHDHAHAHDHAPVHQHASAFAHTHSHDGHTHTHAVPETITMGSLLGLGVSGGLVPCPSALVLLLSAISLGQVAIGLALLSAFSAGLAVVLIAVGGVVLYGKSLLPKGNRTTHHPALRLLPVFSSVVVIVVGMLMTLTAAGLIQPVKLLS